MRHFSHIWNLGLKELRSLFSDRLLVLIIAIVFSGVIYNTAIGTSIDVRNASVGIHDLDRSALTEAIRDAIRPPEFQRPLDVPQEQIHARMNSGELIFVLAFPPDFQRDLLAGRHPEIQLLIDATTLAQAGIGQIYLQQIIHREIRRFLTQAEDGGEARMPVRPVMRILYNPNTESIRYTPVMEIGSMATLMALILVGAAVIRERERGTIEHLLVMPVNATEIVLSKIMANALVILAAALLSMTLMVETVLGIPLNGSLLLYAGGLALYLFSIASLGIMLATIAPTMPQFGLLMMPVYVVSLMFSGAKTPRSNMPAFARQISEYWPTTQFMDFSQNVLFRGAGADIVWPQLLLMSITGLIFLGLALFRFKRMLEQQG